MLMKGIYTNIFALTVSGFLTIALAKTSMAYPIDGYTETGIRRLEYYRLSEIGEIKGKNLYEGAKLKSSEVMPRLLDASIFPGSALNLPAVDKKFTKQIKHHIVQEPNNYSVAVLDLSDPNKPIYAEHNGDYIDNVGSIGKILVAVVFFAKLKDVYPNSIEKRQHILKTTMLTADSFSSGDHHKVFFWDIDKKTVDHRAIHKGDQGNLYEYLDWALSPSSNAAAAMLQKELILLSHFKERYPATELENQNFLKKTSKTELGKIFLEGMIEPLKQLGINTDRLRQGSFFTRAGKNRVLGTNSVGNTRELVKLLYLMEKGQLIDKFSSIEIKRLLYSTERRIRYASHPALNPFPVYFKSGSLYSCKPEEGFTCGKYKGNKRNVLASVTIVETPKDLVQKPPQKTLKENSDELLAEGPEEELKYHYIAVVQSKVLKVNSAVAHQTLALRIHRLIEKLHQDE